MSHPPPHYAHPQQGQPQYGYAPQQQYAPQHYPPGGYGPPPPSAHSSHGRFAPPPQPQYAQPPPSAAAAVPAQAQAPPAQAPGVPYIGARISLISNMNIRYEGILYTIDTKAATVALQHVRCFGTEDRPGDFVPASPDVYEFIIYSGKDIKDLSVLQPQQPAAAPPQDPAILSAQAPPPQFNQPQQPAEVEIQPEQEVQQQQQQPQPSHPRQQRGGRAQPPQQQGARHTVRMINEQPQQPQQAAPAAAAAPIEQGEFDMQGSNARFAKVTSADSKQDESASSSSVPSYELPSADGGLDTSGFPVVQKKYDPKKSFFDELTTDRGSASAPGAGREMRRIDTDTFGADAQGFRARHGRNGGGGGGGGGGGQGGQRRARGRGNQAGGQQQPQQGQWRNEAQN